MVKVLVTDTYTPESLALLKSKGDLHIEISPERTPNLDNFDQIEVLLTRSRTLVGPLELEKLPQLKLIVTATSGFDHIDLEACRKKNIKVCHTPLAQRDSAAELTLFLLLSSARQITAAQGALKSHKWKDGINKGLSLKGKTLGIIGLGRIGSRVAELAASFGMKLLAYDPYQPDSQFEKFQCQRVGFMELVREAQFVTLHVPLNDETRQMINHQTLEHFSHDCYLINASRGEVVNEGELITALENKVIAGAALDVFEKEPLVQASRLRHRPDVTLTPHIGAYTSDAYQQASLEAAEIVVAFVNGKEIPCL